MSVGFRCVRCYFTLLLIWPAWLAKALVLQDPAQNVFNIDPYRSQQPLSHLRLQPAPSQNVKYLLPGQLDRINRIRQLQRAQLLQQQPLPQTPWLQGRLHTEKTFPARQSLAPFLVSTPPVQRGAAFQTALVNRDRDMDRDTVVNNSLNETNSGGSEADNSFAGLFVLLCLGAGLCMYCTIDHVVQSTHPVIERVIDEDLFSFEERFELHNPKDVAPEGNIFRFLARQTEELRNRHDLYTQMMCIANNEFEIAEDMNIAGLLDDIPWNEPKLSAQSRALLLDGMPEPRNKRWIRLKKLEMHLLLAIDSYTGTQTHHHGDHSPRLSPRSIDRDSPIVLEFLKNVIISGGTRRLGPALIPIRNTERRAWFKERAMAFLIFMLMLGGPAFILYEHWISSENRLSRMQSSDLSFRELTCIKSDRATTQILGCVFLIIIIEYTRSVCKGELQAFKKMRHLPADTFWLRLGQIANSCCIALSVLALPLIFWSEVDSQGIVFDAMALLFVFSVDNLGSEAVTFLLTDDDEFQTTYTDLIKSLHRCPADLTWLLNTEARDASQIWDLRFETHGNFAAFQNVPKDTVRLREDDNKSEGLIYKAIANGSEFKLSQRPGQKATKQCWTALSYILIALEVVIPFLYVFASKPCYRQTE